MHTFDLCCNKKLQLEPFSTDSVMFITLLNEGESDDCCHLPQSCNCFDVRAVECSKHAQAVGTLCSWYFWQCFGLANAS